MLNIIRGSRQRGQVLIIVILVLLVVSLIILAAASRSITDVRISKTSEDSQRAFSAAEAGVEEAVEKIKTGTVQLGVDVRPSTLTNNATVSYIVTEQGNSSLSFLSPQPIGQDVETLQVYLANKDNPDTDTYTGTSICIVWGDGGTQADQEETPALEATLLYKKTDGKVVTKRFAIDPNSARTSSNHFLTPVSGCQTAILASGNNLGIDRTFAFSHSLTFGLTDAATNCDGSSCLYALRLRLLYNKSTSHYIGVSPQGGDLPAQGFKISSTGTSATSTRKVEVFQAYPSMPAIFDFALFNGSEDELTKR